MYKTPLLVNNLLFIIRCTLTVTRIMFLLIIFYLLLHYIHQKNVSNIQTDNFGLIFKMASFLGPFKYWILLHLFCQLQPFPLYYAFWTCQKNFHFSKIYSFTFMYKNYRTCIAKNELQVNFSHKFSKNEFFKLSDCHIMPIFMV